MYASKRTSASFGKGIGKNYKYRTLITLFFSPQRRVEERTRTSTQVSSRHDLFKPRQSAAHWPVYPMRILPSRGGGRRGVAGVRVAKG